jgi:uncharacterized protein YllA (UPF0747 family)
VDLSNPEGSPSGWLSLGDDVSAAASSCLSSLPESEFLPQVREIVTSSYKPGLSPVDAFGRLMARLFQGTPLVLVNPLDNDLRRLGTPTLDQAVRQNAEVRSAVLARSRALSEAGYHEQVKVDHNFTGVFAYRGKSRQVLRPDEINTDAPLSANVLLRPAFQDSIFPTAAFVGGPAEVAYFAQAVAVYETLRRPVPPVVPRISATVLEPRVLRALKKYDMEFLDAFRGREFMKRKAVANISLPTPGARTLRRRPRPPHGGPGIAAARPERCRSDAGGRARYIPSESPASSGNPSHEVRQCGGATRRDAGAASGGDQ